MAKSEDIITRFWQRVNITPTCWEWTAAKQSAGYGVFRIGRNPGKLFYAHRFSDELSKGPITDGLCVLHKCDNRICVNPDHLFRGTRTDNAVDKVKKGRQSFTPGKKGENSPNAKLSASQVLDLRLSYIPKRFGATRLSRQFGISKRQVLRILHGKSWT